MILIHRSTTLLFTTLCSNVVQLVAGERMNKLNSIVISLFRRWRGYARTEATEFELIVASVFMSGFVIQSGALMYHLQVQTLLDMFWVQNSKGNMPSNFCNLKLQEGWTLIDSMYYTFITLSTIGFGDFVALQNESKDLQVT